MSRSTDDEMPFPLALTLALTLLSAEQRAELAALGARQLIRPLPASPVDLSHDRPGLPPNVIDFNKYRLPAPQPCPTPATPRLPSTPDTAPAQAKRSLNWAFGAMILTCLAIVPFLFAPLPGSTPGEYITGLGEHGVIPLSDGSQVTMNTQSRMRVHFSKHERYIELIEGEAIFSVARDGLRPFRVHAGRTVVEAVGTEFSIYIGNSGTKIAVTQGRVKVFQDVNPAPVVLNPDGLLWTDTLAFDSSRQDRGLLLSAGEEACVNPESFADFEADTRAVPISEIQRQWAWADGNLVFHDATLTDVVAEFNRYNWRKLKVADPSIGQYHIGGVFNTTDTESLLQALAPTLHISSRFVGTPGSPDAVIELRQGPAPYPSGPPP